TSGFQRARDGKGEEGDHRGVEKHRGRSRRARSRLLRPEALPRSSAWNADYRQGGEHRSEEHTSELQSRGHLVCRLLLEKRKMCYLLVRNLPCTSPLHLSYTLELAVLVLYLSSFVSFALHLTPFSYFGFASLFPAFLALS